MGAFMVHRLTGVYHADGGLRGELAYVIGKIRGTAHCALCDVTHRGLSRRPAWTRLVARLGVPFDLVHLNERSPELTKASGGRTPCVLAHTDAGLVMLLDPAGLDRVHGDLEQFATALVGAAKAAGLTWPAADRTG